MAIDKKVNLSEAELNERYTAAAYKFTTVSGWREYLALAEDFRILDTHKDSAQKYSQCVKAASATAYRDVTEGIREKGSDATAADYREAARILQIIQDYRDAREVMRVYTVRATVLTYDAAMAILSDSEATTEAIGEGVDMLKSIKGYKNTRELIERFERYYFERMYSEALRIMENGHVFSEFEEAAVMFDKIAEYSDAAQQAAACRKTANKLRPKEKKKKPVPSPDLGGDEAVRVKGKSKREGSTSAEDSETVKPPKRKRIDDETHNSLVEVWYTIDKRRMVDFIIWLLLLAADIAASMILPNLEGEYFRVNQNSIRVTTVLIAAVIIAMGCRAFLRMLTASMRKKLAQAALRFAKKLAAPVVKLITKLLLSIGIDLSRRNRLGGRDERTFVFDDAERVKKPKKKLKNDLKWVDQTDNAARVRYIFIDYMVRRIRKGYFMKRSMTPAEICVEVALEDDERALFAVYDKARYAGQRGLEEITDAVVGELQMVNRKRSQ